MSADALCDFVQRLFLIPEITRIVGGVDELWGTVLVRFKGQPFPCFNFTVAVLRGSEKVEIQGVPLVSGEGDGAQTAAGFGALLFGFSSFL